MKTMKRMMAVLVVLAMLLSMACTSAYANITITGVKDGHTYTVYKLMDLQYDSATGTYAYTVASKWLNFFKSGEGKEYVTLDNANQVTWIKPNDEATAKALAAAAVAAGIANDGTETAASGAAEFAGLTPGYYVVESSAGTFLTLNSVYGDTLSLSEKNSLPNVTKGVKNEGTDYATTVYAELGDTVNYKITVAAEAGAKNYIVEDQLPSGITYGGDVKVFDKDNNEITASAETYEASYDSATRKLTVVFKQAYLNGLTKGQETYITYSGTVNSNVTTGNGADTNQNTAVLMVSGVAADSAVANVNTFKIQVNKVDKADTTKLLEGAEFKLYSASNAGYMKVVDGKIEWETEANADVFATDTNGTFEIKGLVPGTYELKEIKAPAGYNLLTTPETVLIKTEGLSDGENGDVTVTVENSKGQVLPGTGGMGTTLFYAFGGILMAGAAVLLVSKKRRAN